MSVSRKFGASLGLHVSGQEGRLRAWLRLTSTHQMSHDAHCNVEMVRPNQKHLLWANIA